MGDDVPVRMHRSMAVPGELAGSTTSLNLRVAQLLSALIVVLAAVAAASGLFMPGLYRDASGVIPAMQGQDLVTLIMLPCMVVTLLSARRGSARATMVWIGLLGYLFYAYTGAAFAYRFNQLFLVYLALFSMSVFALAAAATGIDASGLKRSFDAAVPRWPVVISLILLAIMLAMPELAQVVSALGAGTAPELITRSGGAGNFVYVLDLGIVMPLSLLSALLLWQRSPWGYLLAGGILIKGITMGLAPLCATWFSVRAGMPLEVELTAIYALIAAGSLGMSVWFLRHCQG